MKKFEKLVLWLIPVAILCAVYRGFSSLLVEKYFSDIPELPLGFVYSFLIVLSGFANALIINLIIGAWLFFISKKTIQNSWTWAFVGIIYGLWGILFYCIVVIQNNDHKNLFSSEEIYRLGKFCIPILIIIPFFYIFGIFNFTIPTDSEVFNTLDSILGNKRFSISSLFFTLTPTFINIFFSIWFYRTANKISRIPWIWSLFVLYEGVLPIILFSALHWLDHKYSVFMETQKMTKG